MGWNGVPGAVLQGAVSLSVLLNTFVKDVEQEVSRKVTEVASDMNLLKIERIRADSEALLKYYRRLTE